MQRKFGDVVADIDFLARGIALEAARDRDRGCRLGAVAGELRDLSQQQGEDPISLPAAARLAYLRRQHGLLDAMAEKICADVSAYAQSLALADGRPEVAAWSDYRDADLRELVTELSASRQQFKQDLQRDRARIDLAVRSDRSGSESRNAATAGEKMAGFDKISLDRGDIEMV